MFCLPRPHDRFETGTPVVLIAIAVLDALLLLPVLSQGQSFLDAYGFRPTHPSLLTFFAALFLHVGIFHYIGNMWFFWIFGKKIEATLGHAAFAGAFLLCGVSGQLVYWLTAIHSNLPCVGASGAISGVAGMYLVLYPRDRFDLMLFLGYWRVKTIESDARVAVLVWIGEQFVLGLITLLTPISSVAFWAHVGGFAAGMGVAALYRACVPVTKRPSFARFEVPLQDEVEQPNELVGLNLGSAAAPKRATEVAAVTAGEPE